MEKTVLIGMEYFENLGREEKKELKELKHELIVRYGYQKTHSINITAMKKTNKLNINFTILKNEGKKVLEELKKDLEEMEQTYNINTNLKITDISNVEMESRVIDWEHQKKQQENNQIDIFDSVKKELEDKGIIEDEKNIQKIDNHLAVWSMIEDIEKEYQINPEVEENIITVDSYVEDKEVIENKLNDIVNKFSDYTYKINVIGFKPMNHYFENIETVEDLKQQYKKLAKKYHPDLNKDFDTNEIMKQINQEFEELSNKIGNKYRNKDGKIYESKNDFNYKEYINIINKLLQMENIKIEIIGSFIWVSGETLPYRKELKDLGLKWSPNKKMWYKSPDGYRKYGNKKYSYSEIKTMYISTTINKNNDDIREA